MINLKKSLLASAALVMITAHGARAASNVINSATSSTVTLGTSDTLTVQNGGSVTVGAGNDVNATGSPSGAITVQTGGSITNTGSNNNAAGGEGIYVSGTAASITNQGTITSDNARAIMVEGTVTGGIDNTGTLEGGGHGLEISGGTVGADGSGNAIYNSGTMQGDGSFGDSSGIRLGSAQINGNIFNDTGGTITSTAYGLNIQPSSTVTGNFTNSGTVFGGTDAILLSGTGTIIGGIVNNVGGVINGTGVGICIDDGANGSPCGGANTPGQQGSLSSVTNSGTIESSTGTAVYNGGTLTTLTNNVGGVITTDSGVAVYNIDNGMTTLTNHGTIQATASGNAIYNSAPITSLTNTGTISGAGTANGILNSSTIGTLSNTAGTISAVDGNAIQINHNYNSYINVGTLANTGTIRATGAGNAIYTTGGVNGYYAIDTLTNAGGTISAVSGAGIAVGDDEINVINNNSGTIHATSGYAIQNGFGIAGMIDTITNNGGTISATSGYGIYNNTSSTIGTVDNTNGMITATANSGTAIFNSGTINSLTNTGTISATTNGFGIDDNGGSIGTLTNSGTITVGNGSSAVYQSGGSIGLINSGTIHATDTLAFEAGGAWSLNNTNGTISATTGIALQAYSPITGTLTNTGGLITSASTGAGTFDVETDMAGLTVSGGTISNTSALNTATALNIGSSQTAAIVLNGVHLIADGDTANSGHGIAINATGNATVNLDSASVVRGQILESGGALTLNTSAAITGNITTGAGNDGITINGGSIAGNINLGAGTNSLAVNSAFTTGGTISTSGAINTTVGGAGNFIVNNNVGLGSGTLTVNNGGTLNLATANVTTTGAFSNSGTTIIGNGRTLSVGSIGGTGILQYNLGTNAGAVTSGTLNTGVSAANLTNQTIQFSQISGAINTSSQTLIATGTGAATLPSASVANNSYAYDFSLLRGSGGQNNNIYLVASVDQSSANNSNNANAANSLLGSLATSTNSIIQQIQNSLTTASSRNSYNNTLAATLPNANNGAPQAATSFTGQAIDVTNGQLAAVQTGSGASGISSGEDSNGLHYWLQGFGQHENQGYRNNIDGYSANSYGIALGADTRKLEKNNVLGMSFAFGNTRVVSQNINATHTDIDSYQLTAYGNHAMHDNYFVAGMAGFGYDHNQNTRYAVGGISGLNAGAGYQSWQGAGRAELGRNFYASLFGSPMLTPLLTADYVHYHADGYTESGAGGADLRVSGLDQDTLNLGLGGRAAWDYAINDSWHVKPNLHINYQYNVLNNNSADVTSTFVAGGSTFATAGVTPARSTWTFGTGANLYGSGNWNFTANYDLTLKQDYTANTGTLRAEYQF